LLRDGGSAVLRKHLTQELGMCCGGEMTIHLEALGPAPRLIVLGAGYIAQPLAAIALQCGFAVTVADARPEWLNPERFPGCTLIERDPELALSDLPTTEHDYVVIATHDHALDQRIVQVALPRPLRFLGMIGSRPKQRKFALRLRARGFSDAEIMRLHSPLGFPIGAETPEEIAVSAMAAIIAARRGAPLPVPWVAPAGAGRSEDPVRRLIEDAVPQRTGNDQREAQ
jgi:xanthine dehydrogenase accessory factor